MTAGSLLAIIAVICAGAVLAAQSPVNAALARGVGDPLVAACLNFLVGFLVLAAVWGMRGTVLTREGLFAVPAWAWIGGAMGAFYIGALIWAVPRTGAFTAMAGVVFGQLAAALILDRVGAFGLAVQDITWTRAAGLGLVMAGLLLSRV